MPAKHRKLIILILLVTLFAGLFFSHKSRVVIRNYSDFDCYYVAGKRILENQNIYVIKDTKTSEFRYAPVFAVLMSPLSLMKEYDADTAWFIINYLLLILIFVILKKMVCPWASSPKTAFFIYAAVIILTTSRFILHNLDSGQVNIFMLASLVGGLYCAQRKQVVAGGMIIALSVMIKYTPLIFIPLFLLRKDIKLAIVTMASVLIYFLLPSLFIGFKTNFLYLNNMLAFLTKSTIFTQSTIMNPKNQSLLSAFYRFFTDPDSFYAVHPPMPYGFLPFKHININLAYAITAITLYLLILWKPQKNDTDKRREELNKNVDYSLLLICAVLFNMNAWMHNYIFLAMPYFLIICYLLKNSCKDMVMITGLILSIILNTFSLRPFVSAQISYDLHYYSPYTVSALILFFLLLKIKFSHKCRNSSPSTAIRVD